MSLSDGSAMDVGDITQCSICLETFKEPKALPCIHTFCLSCLDQHCREKGPNVPCPLCRKDFPIPIGGIKDLPNNFMILQLMEVNRAEAISRKESPYSYSCERCSNSQITSYCVECDKYICERCAAIHASTDVYKSHLVVPKSDRAFIESSKKKIKLSADYCDQHPAEQNTLFCNDCKTVTCPVCIGIKHRKHDLTDAKELAEVLRLSLKDNVDYLSVCAQKKWEKITQLDIASNCFTEKIETTLQEVSLQYDHLVSRVQSHKIALTEELNAFKMNRLSEVETEKVITEEQFTNVERLKRHVLKLIETGTTCDILRTTHDLQSTVKELVEAQDESDGRRPSSVGTDHRLSEVQITFTPFLSDGERNLIGSLAFKGAEAAVSLDPHKERDPRKCNLTEFLDNSTLLHLMPSRSNPITGLTVLDGEVFVARYTSHVEVYKSDDFTLRRTLCITGANQVQELVSCPCYYCLYAVDRVQKMIFRYDIASYVTSKLSVSGEGCSLSVTQGYHLLVASFEINRIRKYTTHGALIIQIDLDSSITDQLYHCVQLHNGNYLVSLRGTQRNRVSIVDQIGLVVLSDCETPASENGKELYTPGHMVVDAYDNVLVVDGINYRVLLLSPTLTYLGDIAIAGDRFNQPHTAHYDELSRRLYVGEFAGGRVLVLESLRRMSEGRC